MPLTPTPNLGLIQPEPGADDDIWGGELNNNLTVIDALFADDGAAGTVLTYGTAGDIVATTYKLATTAALTTTEVSIGLDGSNNLDISTTTGGPAIEVSQATSVVNFDKVPTVGGVSMPAGLGLGELRTGLGTADVLYGNGEAWLVCDGRTLSAAQQNTYAGYVARYGAVLPDLANRTPRGYQSGVTPGPGGGMGSDSVQLSVDNLPSHNHPGSTTTPQTFDAGHAHGASGNLQMGAGAPGGGGGTILTSGPASVIVNEPVSVTVNSVQANIQNPTVETIVAAQGSGVAFSVVPASTVVTYFVRVA